VPIIKGNITSKGDHIYHVPGSSSYNGTKISESKGERWFYTEEEARNAGWRPPKG
jgi:micrococcal nuclease